MVKKNKKTNKGAITLVAVAIVAIALIIVGIYSQSFALLGESAWIPEYWTAECVERPESMSVVDIGKIDNSGEFFACTTKDTGRWIPEVNGIQCNFYVVNTGFSYSVYDCPLDATKDTVRDRCEKVKGQLGVYKDIYTVIAGRKLWIDPTSTLGLGGVNLQAEYPSYGLRVRQASGYVDKYTTSCVANTIEDATGKNTHTLDLEDAIVVVPGSPFNAVTGLRQAQTTQLVTLENVNNGRAIYISRPGYYYQVREAEDGFLYVHTTQEYKSSRIECIPRTTGCSDDAKIVKIEDQSCDIYGGAVTDYSPVQGDQTKLCKYSCNDGKLKVTNDCIDVVNDCPDDKPLWNVKTGECVAVITPETPGEDEFDPFFLYLGIGVIFAMMIMLFIRMSLDRGGSKNGRRN